MPTGKAPPYGPVHSGCRQLLGTDRHCKIDGMTRVAAGDKTGWVNCPPPHVIPDGNPLAGSGRTEFFHLPAANRGCIG